MGTPFGCPQPLKFDSPRSHHLRLIDPVELPRRLQIFMSKFVPRIALLSVSDKTGLSHLARTLEEQGCRILSTGGTFSTLRESGIKVEEVSQFTSAPEMFNGRVKTLHPKIAGGILARRDVDQDEMIRHEVSGIDLVVVNLYPFEAAIADPSNSIEEITEQIDIGGPTLIRAAAKNHKDVLVVVDPSDYPELIERCQKQSIDLDYRNAMAAKAFRHTAAYDAVISNYLSANSLPEKLTLTFNKHSDLRYGENPHQVAAFYTNTSERSGSIGSIEQLQGKDLSYNNLADTDAAINCISMFEDPACAIVKHGNPCGLAIADSPLQAYEIAFDCDPTSAFGGVIAFNRSVDTLTVEKIISNQFLDVLIAPSYEAEALKSMQRRKRVRVLATGDLSRSTARTMEIRQVRGGLLVQSSDAIQNELQEFDVVSNRHPDEQELNDLAFAWKVAMLVKSNAIVYARDQMTIGIGAGQMNRVLSARIARIRAQEENLLHGKVVMASDALFPFRDSIDTAAEAGITAVIQPGGSIRDDEVIQAANDHDIAMIFTGVRHFRH